MSVELLPPDRKHPKKWHVQTNYCRCHPETCGCNDWAVYEPDGRKHDTFYHKEQAENYVKLKLELDDLKRKLARKSE